MSTLGIGTYVEQPQERAWDSRRGYVTTRKFEGTASSLETLATTLASQGYSWNIQYGPVCKLTASISADFDSGSGSVTEVETVVDTWELSANVAEKDILNSESALVTTAQADLRTLRDILDGKKDIDLLTSSDVTTSAGWKLALLISQGVKSTIVYQPILRHTQTASNGWTVPNSLTNVGKVYTTAQLLSAENVPVSLNNNLTASSSVTRTDTGTDIVYTYGWLKTHPQIVDAAFQKIQVVQEWQWGLWSTDLYTFV